MEKTLCCQHSMFCSAHSPLEPLLVLEWRVKKWLEKVLRIHSLMHWPSFQVSHHLAGGLGELGSFCGSRHQELNLVQWAHVEKTMAKPVRTSIVVVVDDDYFCSRSTCCCWLSPGATCLSTSPTTSRNLQTLFKCMINLCIYWPFMVFFFVFQGTLKHCNTNVNTLQYKTFLWSLLWHWSY